MQRSKVLLWMIEMNEKNVHVAVTLHKWDKVMLTIKMIKNI